MGLFPEIGRAWLTIDSEIYIWTFNQTRDVAYYDGLSHLIVSVGLVKPKPGVFVQDVKYLLVLTTPIEVIVLGVTFGESSYNEMQLMNRPVFVIGTDNVSISVIKGTDDGRIFLGGRDGCLYEIYYQAESSWFGKRCKKINLSQGLVSYMVPSFLKVFSVTIVFTSKNVRNNLARFVCRKWIQSNTLRSITVASFSMSLRKKVSLRLGTSVRVTRQLED